MLASQHIDHSKLRDLIFTEVATRAQIRFDLSQDQLAYGKTQLISAHDARLTELQVNEHELELLS